MTPKFKQLAALAANNGKRIGAAVATGLLSAAVMAQTAADPVTTAADDIIAKVTEYGGKLVLVAAAGVVFGVAIKYVKKIRGAS